MGEARRKQLAAQSGAVPAQPAQAPSSAGLAPAARLQAAQVALARRDVAAALTVLDNTLAAQPRDVPALMLRAGVREALGQAEPAVQDFLAAAAVEPGLALAHFGAAGQLFKLDRLPEAMACHARAVALDATLLADGRPGYALASGGNGPDAAQPAFAASRCHAGPGAPTPGALLQAVTDCELVVVDDFLPDPNAHRAFALSLPYLDSSAHHHGNFPGRQTRGGHDAPAHTQRLADLLGRDLKWTWPGHGAFRLSPAGSLARSDVHADHGDARIAYAGVLYLSLDAHCQGGTSFWRHRETGWTRPPTPAQAQASRFGSVAGFMQSEVAAANDRFDRLTSQRTQWDLLFEVPMRFNRLIAYRSDHFHSVSSVFGGDPATSRLVQLFFFEPMARRPAGPVAP